MLVDKEIRKSTKSPTGSDVSKIRLDNFYSRPMPTIPENFMKIRPRVQEKSSKKNKNNNNQTRSRCEQRGGLPSDFGAVRVKDGRMNSNFDSEFEAIFFLNLLYQQFQN